MIILQEKYNDLIAMFFLKFDASQALDNEVCFGDLNAAELNSRAKNAITEQFYCCQFVDALLTRCADLDIKDFASKLGK